LNEKIVQNINEAAGAWGVQCLRYEIRDISPPASVRSAMDMQAEAGWMLGTQKQSTAFRKNICMTCNPNKSRRV
jgi:hypothetical protein